MCKTNAISRLYSNIVKQCNTCLLSMAQRQLTSVRGVSLSLFPAWQSHTDFSYDHKSVPFKAVTVPALCKPSSSSIMHRYCIQQSIKSRKWSQEQTMCQFERHIQSRVRCCGLVQLRRSDARHIMSHSRHQVCSRCLILPFHLSAFPFR